jgi:hypothetical protein
MPSSPARSRPPDVHPGGPVNTQDSVLRGKRIAGEDPGGSADCRLFSSIGLIVGNGASSCIEGARIWDTGGWFGGARCGRLVCDRKEEKTDES